MTKEEIISKSNHYITTIASVNTKLNKYYDYYNGKRDPKVYSYLTENFGVQNPFDVPFIPVVHSHCKSLIGQYLNTPNNNWTVTTSDSSSVKSMQDEKHKFILTNLKEVYFKYNGGDKDMFVKKAVEDLDFNINNGFKSSIEVVGNNLVKYYWNNLKLQGQYKKVLEHLIISGRGHTREYIDEISKQPKVDVIDTRNIWYRKTQDTNNLSQADSVVRRMFIDRQEILARWGNQMTSDEVESIESKPAFSSQAFISSSYTRDIYNRHKESAQYDSDFYQNDTYYNYPGAHDYNKLEVYHVEFVVVEPIRIGGETRFKQELMECYRIGNDIFVGCGKAKYVERSIDDPYRVKLSYKGVILDDLGTPFSFIGRTADIQDNYDIIHYLLMNVLANSGVKVDTTVLEHIPKHYGTTPEERILMNKAMKKHGEKIITISQMGTKDFNNYGQAVDMAVDERTLGAYINMLNYYEGLISKITGVSPQVLAQIDQREAVNNVKTSLNQSATLNRPLFALLDELISSSLTSLLNLTKFSIEKPAVLTFIHNNAAQLFNISPEEVWSDFNVFVVDKSTQKEKLEFVKGIGMEAVKGGLLQIDTIIDAGLTDSATLASQLIREGVRKQKEDNTAQLNSQLQEATKKIQELTKQIEAASGSEMGLKKQQLDLEKHKIDTDTSLREKQLTDTKDFNDRKIGLEEKRVKAEVLQLYDNNGNNDEIRNN